jgi:hypothetical protein
VTRHTQLDIDKTTADLATVEDKLKTADDWLKQLSAKKCNLMWVTVTHPKVSICVFFSDTISQADLRRRQLQDNENILKIKDRLVELQRITDERQSQMLHMNAKELDAKRQKLHTEIMGIQMAVCCGVQLLFVDFLIL